MAAAPTTTVVTSAAAAAAAVGLVVAHAAAEIVPHLGPVVRVALRIVELCETRKMNSRHLAVLQHKVRFLTNTVAEAIVIPYRDGGGTLPSWLEKPLRELEDCYREILEWINHQLSKNILSQVAAAESIRKKADIFDHKLSTFIAVFHLGLDTTAIDHTGTINQQSAWWLRNQILSFAHNARMMPSIRRLLDLLLEANEYVGTLLTRPQPPASKIRRLWNDSAALAAVNTVSAKLDGYANSIKDQLLGVLLDCNIALHGAVRAEFAKAAREREAFARSIVTQVVERLEQQLAKVSDIAASTPNVDRQAEKVADIVLESRHRNSLLMGDIALGNISFDKSVVALKFRQLDEEAVAVSRKMKRQINFDDLKEWMVHADAVVYNRDEDSFLGEGASSKVYIGIMDGIVVAVKVFANKAPPFELEKSIGKEVEAWRQVSHHQNIVSLLGVSTKTKQYIVAEYCKNGTAREYLNRLRRESYSEWCTALVNVLRDAAEGLRFLHSQGLLHRDIKGANIFVREDGTAAIGDFGHSRAVGNISTMSGLKQAGGTLNWCSPEQLTQPAASLTSMSDTWSFGVTVFELAADQSPFAEYTDVRAAITASPPWLPPAFPVADPALRFLDDLARACCVADPALRISDNEIAARLEGATPGDAAAARTGTGAAAGVPPPAEWSPATAYTAGGLVTFEGVLYSAVQLSGDRFVPAQATAALPPGRATYIAHRFSPLHSDDQRRAQWAAAVAAQDAQDAANPAAAPLRWVSVTPGAPLPDAALKLGAAEDGVPLYAARAYLDSGVQVGKASAKSAALLPY
ncbi:hypothetical protein HK405_004572, partial [Cladochytrium tenue]